jgi:hypothetical protein
MLGAAWVGGAAGAGAAGALGAPWGAPWARAAAGQAIIAAATAVVTKRFSCIEVLGYGDDVPASAL